MLNGVGTQRFTDGRNQGAALRADARRNAAEHTHFFHLWLLVETKKGSPRLPLGGLPGENSSILLITDETGLAQAASRPASDQIENIHTAQTTSEVISGFSDVGRFIFVVHKGHDSFLSPWVIAIERADQFTLGIRQGEHSSRPRLELPFFSIDLAPLILNSRQFWNTCLRQATRKECRGRI
jgi:hypothetical protein